MESWTARREAEKAKGRNGNGFGVPLDMAVRMIPTPAARDYRTPNAKPYSERGGGKKGEQLPNYVKFWPTPKSSPSGPDYARTGRTESGGDDLATAVAREVFSTPRSGGRSLDGGTNSRKRAKREGVWISGQLNPTWVEWLMGLPIGWTALRPVGTEWSRWSALMRGALSTLNSSPAVIQPDLFDEGVA